jgi:hypothetical protein
MVVQNFPLYLIMITNVHVNSHNLSFTTGIYRSKQCLLVNWLSCYRSNIQGDSKLSNTN